MRPGGREGPLKATLWAFSSGVIAEKLAEAVVNKERNYRRRRLVLSVTPNRESQALWVSWS